MATEAPPAAPEESGALAQSAPLTPADERLIAYFQDLEQKSLDTLEGAARQLITLVTTLLGLFFGVLAFKDHPTYLALPAVRILGGLAAGFYVLTLFLALDVVMPRRLEVPLVHSFAHLFIRSLPSGTGWRGPPPPLARPWEREGDLGVR
ncbi:MAG: hypothetical protein H5T61_06600 [Thermoflexales bacterium]|nr:hypothetical protein [Thermoflexales bacterium]